MSRIERIGDCTLYLGDCLEILPTLSGVDAVIADPPYSSGARTMTSIRGRGGMTRGEQWANDPLANDQMTSIGFIWLMRAVAGDCASLLPMGGSFLCFIDWRQYPQLYGAIETVNLRVQTMIVWDKVAFGMGNGFRNQHELLVHASRGVPTIHDRSVGNVISCKRISSSEDHPTEKPTEVYAQIIPVVTELGQTILDPFMGSGTTGVACVNLGRKFIGIEIEERYFSIACRRIEEAYRQPRLFAEPRVVAKQESML